jgi:hypothetical protein
MCVSPTGTRLWGTLVAAHHVVAHCDRFADYGCSCLLVCPVLWFVALIAFLAVCTGSILRVFVKFLYGGPYGLVCAPGSRCSRCLLLAIVGQCDTRGGRNTAELHACTRGAADSMFGGRGHHHVLCDVHVRWRVLPKPPAAVHAAQRPPDAAWHVPVWHAHQLRGLAVTVVRIPRHSLDLWAWSS